MSTPEPNAPQRAPKVVLLVDSVAGCAGRADQAGWTADEHARLEGITDFERRAQYLVGHWRVRGLASLAFGGAPSDWQWSRPAGEPARLLDPGRDAACHASISHSGDQVACVVSREVVGVDIEMIRLERELAMLAKRCLAPDEAERIAGLEGIAQATAFYRGWAIREALGKAAGTGLVPGTARRMKIVPSDPAEATLRLWEMADRVLVLAHPAGAKVEAHGAPGSTPEYFAWDME